MKGFADYSRKHVYFSSEDHKASDPRYHRSADPPGQGQAEGLCSARPTIWGGSSLWLTPFDSSHLNHHGPVSPAKPQGHQTNSDCFSCCQRQLRLLFQCSHTFFVTVSWCHLGPCWPEHSEGMAARWSLSSWVVLVTQALFSLSEAAKTSHSDSCFRHHTSAQSNPRPGNHFLQPDL